MGGYECFNCGPERDVVMIATSLETGKTFASCNVDLPVMFVGALATELGVDAAKLYDTIEKFVKRQQAAAARAAAGAVDAAPAGPDEVDPPDPEDYDPGPEVDDEGGMSEHRHPDPETVVTQ